MKKKPSKISITIFLSALILSFIMNPNKNIFAGNLIEETKLITLDTLKFITPPSDFRAYFMLQSIDDTTIILIGYFVDPEKVITLVTDEGSDNIIDSIVEYYPETKKFKKKKTLSSKILPSDIAELKKSIIEGVVFEKNYSYDMKSLSTLKHKLNEGVDIHKSESGFLVILYDQEKTTTPMNEFFFKFKDDRYDLVFKTNYYKLYNTSIQPPLSFSVYCKGSKDPVVAKYVKELLDKVPH